MKPKWPILIIVLSAKLLQAQNVGIGTNTPSTNLEIFSTPIVKLKLKSNSFSDTSQIVFSNTYGPSNYGTNMLISSVQESGLLFSSKSDLSTNTTPSILTIKPTGIVTIGNSISGLAGLVLSKKVGNVHAIFGDDTYGVSIESNAPGIHFNSYFNASRKAMVTGYMGGFEMETGTGNLSIYTSPNSTSQNSTASIISRFLIKRDGNIGINYTNPTDKLEVEGNIAIRGNNLFEFGKGVAGKEINAGKIGYNAFGQSALTFLGAGTTSSNRRVYFYAEGGCAFNGNIEALTSITVGTNTLPSGYRMAVDGKIMAEELRIQNSTAWPDYVFENSYNLMPLKELEGKINTNKHLPELPSAKVVEEEGFEIGEMQKVLLKKIEELTLYIIGQEKRIVHLESQLSQSTNK